MAKSIIILSAILIGVISTGGMIVAGLFVAYMSEYGAARYVMAGIVCMGGIATGVGIGVLIWKKRVSIKIVGAANAVLVVVILAGVVSMTFPGQVTYSRFGLTVYGLIPVPGFDVRINSAGVLWFRDKTHFVSAGEVRALARPGVEAVVIGIGWDGVVRVDPAVASIEGIEVHALPTPEAIALFNRLKSEGRRVALLAHSTC